MAGALSDTKANQLLDFMFGAGSNALAPATYYVGLSVANPLNDGSGIVEPDAGAGYTRVAITNNATNFPAAVNRSKSNGVELTFPTATEDWGMVTHYFLATTSSVGSDGSDMVSYSELNVSQNIGTTAPARFAQGTMVIGSPGL